MTSSFNPLPVPNAENEFDAIQRQQEQSLALIFGQAEKDGQVLIQNISAEAAQRAEAVESLSEFSGSLMEQLVEQKKKFNEE